MKRVAYSSYSKTKESWLGEVPSHWKARPLWTMFTRSKRTGNEDETLLSVYRDHGVVPKDSREDNFNKPSEDLNAYQLVKETDLVINKMKAWQGSVAISGYRGIVSPAYFVFESHHHENPSYLHHLFRSGPYIGAYMALSKGIRVNQWDLDPQYHQQMPVLVPPIDEQDAIAAFLDCETARIDTLIAKQERLIELLQEKRQALITRAVTKGLDPAAPMKDSGVAWLGEVPAHWEVAKLKHIATVRGGVAKGRNLGDSPTVTLPYLRVANVQDGYIDLTEVAEIEVAVTEVERYSLRKGDVLMNEGGDNDKLGRGDVWNGEIHPCLHQNHVFAVRPMRVVSEWLALLTSAGYAKRFFESRAKQTTNLASISSANLSELPVVLPPQHEQRELLSRVAANLAKLDTLAAKTQSMIELAKEHRSSLISAAVTGKIDVREAFHSVTTTADVREVA